MTDDSPPVHPKPDPSQVSPGAEANVADVAEVNVANVANVTDVADAADVANVTNAADVADVADVAGVADVTIVPTPNPGTTATPQDAPSPTTPLPATPLPATPLPATPLPPNLQPDWDSWVDGELTSPAPIVPGPVAPTAPTAPTAPLPPRSAPPLAMVETAFLSSTACLLWLVNYYFPLGPLLRLGFPLPIALVYLRWGKRGAWMAALVSSLLLSVLMGPTRSLLFLMPFGLLGVLLGSCWRRGLPWSISIGLGTLLSSIGFFFRIWFTSLLLGDDLWVYVTVQVTEMLQWLFLRLGLLVQPELLWVQGFALVLIVVNSVMYLFTVHLLAFLLLERVGSPIPPPPQWVQALVDMDG